VYTSTDGGMSAGRPLAVGDKKATHTTTSVAVNDNAPGIWRDIDKWLEQLAPFRENYEHHSTGETNADSHLKNILVHHQVIVPVTDRKLDLGPWQQVFLLRI